MEHKISWTQETWNPIRVKGGFHGCNKVSPGCLNCYASDMNRRFDPLKREFEYKPDKGSWEFEIHEKTWLQPHFWRKPRMVFVCSMMDLFHEDVDDDQIDQVFDVMMDSPSNIHTYQILTKRPKRMMDYCLSWENNWEGHPPNNIWLGVTAENQEMLNLRVPYLLQTKAAKLFVSYEPALEAIDWSSIPYQGDTKYYLNPLIKRYSISPQVGESNSRSFIHGLSNLGGIDWVIFGCESGAKRRPCELDWIRNGVNQCREAGVAAFVKQLNIGGKVIKDINKFPADLRVRQFPELTPSQESEDDDGC